MTIENHVNRIIKVDSTKADPLLLSRGDPFKNYQLIYRCPTSPAGKSAVIHSITCSNTTGSGETSPNSQSVFLTLSLQDVSKATFYEFCKLGDKIKIPPFSSMAWDKPINLESGDAIYVDTSNVLDNSITILLCAMEFFANTFERYKNTSLILDTSEKLIYACPTDKANSVIHGLQFANIDRRDLNAYSNVTIIFEDTDSTRYIIGNNIKIPPNSNFIWDKAITLIPGQSIYVKANNVSNVHCVASIMEIDVNV